MKKAAILSLFVLLLAAAGSSLAPDKTAGPSSLSTRTDSWSRQFKGRSPSRNLPGAI